ncbi:MAG: fused MFS/spermidine synthase [Acidobacteria bacterium]|nr:fused MFS/spermidine synthase [Acidobacteriota bacterium]
MLIYALTIFISAFLLFQVQPMIAKIILPWFGGGAAVWSACLMFFQMALLLGYLYSHAITKWLTPKAQTILHTCLLLGALAMPVMPGPQWKPADEKEPLLRIVLLLSATVGLPYLMLSTTGPLLQAWYTRASGGKIPYRLFALSNFGSFLALLSFPFVFEPMLTSPEQTRIWHVAFGLFAALAIYTGWNMVRAIPAAESGPAAATDPATQPIGFGRMLLWIALAACASILLLSISSHLTQNVAPMPFLWVLPLSIYLLTFILAFESGDIYTRGTFLPLLAASLGIAAYLLSEDNRDGFGPIYMWSVILFVCCMVCHGELALQKPHPRQLTLFFLMVSVGGALGGLFVAMIAPLVFTGYFELAIGLGMCGVLAAYLVWTEMPDTWRHSQGWAVTGLAVIMFTQLWYHYKTYTDTFHSYWIFAAAMTFTFAVGTSATWIEILKRPVAGSSWMMRMIWLAPLSANLIRLVIPPAPEEGLKQFCLLTAMCSATALALCWTRGDDGRLTHVSLRAVSALLGAILVAHLAYYQHWNLTGYRYLVRNFYGGLKVRDQIGEEGSTDNRALVHGTINHGSQLLDAKRRREATSYYSPKSGFGRAIRTLQERSPNVRVGVTGLGAGVTASFCRGGDYFRFYELNPVVRDIATTWFTFYNDCPGDKDIFLGDARLTLERQQSQQFDLLAMDAFSSDSVPVHLLTKEAFGLYEKHLKPGGVLAINISNRYLNLVPVVTRNAHDYGMTVALVEDDATGADFYSSTSWMLCTKDKSFFDAPLFKNAKNVSFQSDNPKIRQWTDAYSNLFQIMK